MSRQEPCSSRLDGLRKRSGVKVASERIHTNFDYPPIPIRSMDWSAYRDGYEPGCLIGRGPTKDAAITDLLEQEIDRDPV
jgi:hypothetical protein